jgi:hypothetical protein
MAMLVAQVCEGLFLGASHWTGTFEGDCALSYLHIIQETKKVTKNEVKWEEEEE